MPDSHELDDEAVLTLSIEDPSHFSTIIDRYEDSFMKTAYNVVRTREEAEDVVQEAFTKIYVNARRFKKQPGARFKSWAYKILMNTAFTHYQKLKRTSGKTEYLDQVHYDDDGEGLAAETRDLASINDAKAQVNEVIGKMPEHLARLLRSYYLDDKSYQMIAKEEKISMSTLKMRLFRAKRLFRKLAEA
jgi:RNA polymerase sigma factor (sigma-70 family)